MVAKIKEIQVTNFRSFDKLNVKLNDFNVIVGANGSGKSNFVELFKFLRDIKNHGLTNAISLQGGPEYLTNLNIGITKKFSVKVIFALEKTIFGFNNSKRGNEEFFRVNEISYAFAIKFVQNKFGYQIVEDKISFKIAVSAEEKIGEILLFRKDGKIHIKSENLKSDLITKLFPFGETSEFPKNVLFWEFPFILPFFPVFDELNNISVYYIDPKLPKKASPVTGKADLEEDGNNLAIVLKNILSDTQKRKRLYNLINDILPFIQDMDIEKFADKSMLFKLKEKYADKFLPATLVSDGTINITALLIALYFEKNTLTIIEEPERNIHPNLIAKILELMKDVSRKKQIIVTTHSPEVVKYSGLENIFLISRNEKGYSEITKPSEKESVKTFLKNEIGIDELFVQNLLEVN